ncbi:alpha/beta fold hydrolase [Marinoscillum furvescens]|uniref:Proline-specific peptidase n=1 Tax=Marinoscillum furvescens DSM 4134 TaxID=1122208 RepID=A0A3D9KVQ3_MARFU|nr:alpha/beta fold hydrolase [Marinoscillum furvescens]RED91740.1 proline-specific peptidase [Marinoscillum furvescens DSM 4134]
MNQAQYTTKGTGKQDILIIPGGPGLDHSYLQAFFQHLDLSTYRVTTFTPKTYLATDFSKVSYEAFTQDLKEILEEIDATTPIIIGHSFGVTIATEALKRLNIPVKAFISLNMPESITKYNSNLRVLIEQLPESLSSKILEFEEKGDFGDEFFGFVLSEWYPRHAMKITPFPEEFMKSMATFNKGLWAYAMGPNLFRMDGALADWEIYEAFYALDFPKLFVCGDSDTIFTEDVESMAQQSKNGHSFTYPDAAHYPFIENPDTFFRKLNAFLSNLPADTK